MRVSHRFLAGCLAIFALGVGLLGVLRAPRIALRLAMQSPPESLTVPLSNLPPAALAAPRALPTAEVQRHRGVDLPCPLGTPVIASTRGMVLTVGGHSVRVLGPGARLHIYFNLRPLATLRLGQMLKAGELLGQTSDPSGPHWGIPPHLHYGVFAFPGRVIDPRPLFGTRAGGGRE